MTIKNRIELINLFKNNSSLKLGIEIGSLSGNYAKEILNIYDGKLILVDIWNKVVDNTYIDSSNQINYKQVYTECIDNIQGHENRCFMFRIDSQNASSFFTDESFDFVYIDANHSYESVKKDIELWYPKVRKGGILSGHDYLMIDWYVDNFFAPNGKDRYIYGSNGTYNGEFGVNPAVDEFCKQNNYTLNLTTDEWYGSWFIYK